MSKQAHWQNLAQEYEVQMRPWERKSHQISTWRILLMTSALITAIYADQSDQSLVFFLTFLCLSIFAYFVTKHQKILTRIKMLKAKQEIAKKLSHRCDDSWRKETETKGQEVQTENPLGDDLDVLGSQSLFHYLNFTKTAYGQTCLVKQLLEGEERISKILDRQAAIQELLDQSDWWMEFAGSVACFDCGQRITLNDKKSSPWFPKWFIWASFTLSALIILLLLLGLLHILPYGYAAVLILFHLIISFAIRHRCGKELVAAGDYVRILKAYQPLFVCVKKGVFQNELLKQLQQSAIQGQEGTYHLQRVMDFIAMRHNLFATWIVGALFPIDVACVVRFTKWRNEYGQDVESWLMAVGEMEALISLSVLAKVKERWCFPEFSDQKESILDVKEGVHPLIQEEKAIPNSMKLHDGTYLITGSNMSGKTTFLRTLGTLSILARAGAPICAKSMCTSLMQVLTSIRIRDDVNAGISTFYAELLRIKTMIDRCDQKQPLLILIDEIFKGTNSADRILCAKTIIHRLHQSMIITVVSTHDFELCDLEEDPKIHAHNYHFSESYQNDEIAFDYRLRDGRSTTTNAVELLHMVGISSLTKE